MDELQKRWEDFRGTLDGLTDESEAERWLVTLLDGARLAAMRDGQRGAYAVLNAVMLATRDGKLDELLGTKRNSTIEGIASAYIRDNGHASDWLADSDRRTLLARIAGYFPDVSTLEPDEVRRTVRLLVPELGKLGAWRLFGEPQDDHAEKIAAECTAVLGKADRARPVDFVRAVLRGWGVDADTARDWTK